MTWPDMIMTTSYTLRNKGTKAVTVVVPFQKEQFCTYSVQICTF